MSVNNLKPQPAIYVNPVRPFNGSDYKKDFGDDIESINQTVFQSQHRPIKFIYMDIMMLRDIYLGALLNLVTPNEYTYIRENIMKYNDRIIEGDILSYFPEVTSVTISDVLEYINVPNNTLMLAITSPVSQLYTSLPYVLRLMMQHNSMILGKHECGHITICINTYPLPASQQVKEVYSTILKSLHPHFKLQYTSTPLHAIGSEILMTNQKPKYDPMFIYDIISFISESSKSYTSFVKRMAYYNTQIYTPKRVDTELYKNIVKSGQEIQNVFQNTEAVMSLSCKFKYIDVSVCI